MDWLDLLAVQGTLKSLLQHHSSKASILRRSAFFIVQLSHPYMITGKTIALTRQTVVGKVLSLLFNMLSRLHNNHYNMTKADLHRLACHLTESTSVGYFGVSTIQSSKRQREQKFLKMLFRKERPSIRPNGLEVCIITHT